MKHRPHIRTFAAIAAVSALAPAGLALATSPPDSPPPTSPDSPQSASTMPTGSAPAEGAVPMSSEAPPGSEPGGPSDQAAGEVTVFDRDGTPLAAIMLMDATSAWDDHAEDEGPDEGMEYLRIDVTVRSLHTEDDFGISVGDFVLQNAYGFLFDGQGIRTADEIANEIEIFDDADLGPGESTDMSLTFEIDQGVAPDSLFYRAGDDQMVDVADLRPTGEIPLSSEVVDVITSEVTQTSVVTQETEVTVAQVIASEVPVTEETTVISQVLVTEPA